MRALSLLLLAGGAAGACIDPNDGTLKGSVVCLSDCTNGCDYCCTGKCCSRHVGGGAMTRMMPTGMPQPPIPDVVTMTGMPQPPIPDVVTMTGMPQPPIPDVVECACTGNMGKGAMQDYYPQDIGESCGAWDGGMDYCLEGGASFGEDWCPKPWCYAPASCEGSAKASYLTEQEGPDLYYNYDLCGAKDTYTGTDSDPLAGEDEDEDEDDEDEDEDDEDEDDEDEDEDYEHCVPCCGGRPCLRRMLFATQPTPGGLPCC